MTIEFRCSQCNQLLRVPDTAAGKSARCPKCQALMTVPAAGDASINPAGTPPGLAETTVAPAWSPPAPSSGGVESPFGFAPSAGGGAGLPPKPPPSTNPFGDVAGGSPFGAGAAASLNPYASPMGTMAKPFEGAIGERPIVPQQVGIEPIMNYAWQIWQANLGLLVGVTATVIVTSIAISMPFGIVEVTLEANKEPEAATAVSLLGNLIDNLVQLYLGIGQAQIGLALARRQQARYGDLFRAGSLFFPVLGASIIGSIVIGLGFVLLIVPGIILALMLWPFYYLVVDRQTGVMESFSVATTITKGNWGTAFVLALLSAGIFILGCAALCVGILFAAPLITMLWATAYLMMAGQLSTQPMYEQPSQQWSQPGYQA